MTTLRRHRDHTGVPAHEHESIHEAINELTSRLSKMEGKLDIILGIMALTITALAPVLFFILTNR